MKRCYTWSYYCNCLVLILNKRDFGVQENRLPESCYCFSTLLLILGSKPSHPYPLSWHRHQFWKWENPNRTRAYWRESPTYCNSNKKIKKFKKKRGREVAVEVDKNPTHPLKETRMPNATRGVSPPFPRIRLLRTGAGGSSRTYNLTKWCPAGSDAS